LGAIGERRIRHPALDLAAQMHLHLSDASQIHPPLIGQPAGALFNRRNVACCDENDHTA